MCTRACLCVRMHMYVSVFECVCVCDFLCVAGLCVVEYCVFNSPHLFLFFVLYFYFVISCTHTLFLNYSCRCFDSVSTTTATATTTIYDNNKQQHHQQIYVKRKEVVVVYR